MKRLPWIAALLALGLGTPQTLQAEAIVNILSRVVATPSEGEIEIGSSELRDWRTRDAVCVIRQGRSLGCARIRRVLPNGHAIARTGKARGLAAARVGDQIAYRPTDRVRRIRVSQVRTKLTDESEAFGFGFGTALGSGYLLPIASIRFALGSSVALALHPFYLDGTSGTVQQTAGGAFLFTEVYLDRDTFSGFFIEAGPGFYSVKAATSTTTERYTQPAAAMLGGWRGKTGIGIDLSLSGGAQYLWKSSKSTLLRFQGLQPMVGTEASIHF